MVPAGSNFPAHYRSRATRRINNRLIFNSMPALFHTCVSTARFTKHHLHMATFDLCRWQ